MLRVLPLTEYDTQKSDVRDWVTGLSFRFVIVSRSLTIECVNNSIALAVFSIIIALKPYHIIVTIICSVSWSLANIIVQ